MRGNRQASGASGKTLRLNADEARQEIAPAATSEQ
jgi:hypothetical protein